MKVKGIGGKRVQLKPGVVEPSRADLEAEDPCPACTLCLLRPGEIAVDYYMEDMVPSAEGKNRAMFWTPAGTVKGCCCPWVDGERRCFRPESFD